MDLLLYTIFLLWLGCERAPFIEAQCFVRKPDDIPDKEFPDLLKENPAGYSATVRINYYYQNRSAQVTEYYRAEDFSGRVDLERNGSRTSFVYFNRTDEAFTVRDFDCQSTRLNQFKFLPEEDPLDMWVYRHQLRTVLGPSAALLKASVDYRQGLLAYMGNSSRTIRGVLTHFWQQCIQDDRINVQYYFSVDNWKNELGEQAPVHIPLRIVVQGESLSESSSRIFRTYDFFFFRSLLGQEDFLEIPEGKGCVRLAPDLPTCHTFRDRDLSYSAEILYTPSDDLHSFVTYAQFIYDGQSELVAFSYTNWTLPFRDGKRRVDAYRSVVYSVENGLTYRIDPDSKRCSVSVGEEVEAVVDLPDGIQFPFGNQLFLADADKYKYLGQKRRGDILVDVFEYAQKMDPDSIVVSTRYFMPNDEEEEETPVGTSMTVLNTAQRTSVRLAVNFFHFSTDIDDKVSAFDVDACFPRSRDRRWISFVLAVQRDQQLLENMEPYIPAIRREVTEMLMDASGLSWPRISKVLVDSDSSGLYAFVSILDRPDYLLDFTYQPDSVLADLDESVGMTTKRGCAKLCLEYPGMCYAFSYCGRTCYLKTRSSQSQGSGSGCPVYLRKTGYDPLPTTDSSLEKLGLAFDEGQLKISLTVKTVAGKYIEVELPITAFDAEARDPDARYSKIADFDRHYTEYQYGLKLKKGAGYVTNRGGLPYLTCQSICLADPDCQSLSSCAGLAECLLSSKHAKEIPDSELVKKNDCIVLTRNYLDAFARHDGLIQAVTATKRLRLHDQELCARACLLDDQLDCHSFDFCPRSNYTCLLHSVRHLNSGKEKLTFDPTGLCGHYSRNYVQDFRKLKSKSLTLPSRIEIKGVTVEECARLCAEETGFDCRSFQFCRQKANCKLSGGTDVPPPTVYDAKCDVYSLTEKPEQRKRSRSVGGRTYSSGLAAGLGVFFCVLGLGFGIIALLLFGKLTGRKI